MSDPAGPTTLDQLIAALSDLADLDPVTRARRCPPLQDAAKRILGAVRDEAVHAASRNGYQAAADAIGVSVANINGAVNRHNARTTRTPTPRAERNDDRNQQRRMSYARRNPDVIWPEIFELVESHLTKRGAPTNKGDLGAVTEHIVAHWCSPDRPRGTAIAQFVTRLLNDAGCDVLPDGDDTRWQGFVTSLRAAGTTLVRPTGPGQPIGRGAAIALQLIRDAPVAWTSRICHRAGAWHVAALSDAGLVRRRRQSPLTLEITAGGRRVSELLDGAGFGAPDYSQEAWSRARSHVASAVCG